MKKNLYNTTPIITQYLKIKNKYKNILLLYRMGDFYEFLFEDAHQASALLNIQLTSKGKYNNKPIPMAGIPSHSINTYLKRIITTGISVAICEQIPNKKTNNKKLIERKVIRVITPGTIYEEHLLDENKDNLILSIIYQNNIWGIAWLELTTGDFGVLEVNNQQKLILELERLNPVELLIPSSTQTLPPLPIKKSIINHINEEYFHYQNAYNILYNKLKIKNIDTKLHNGVSAAGAIIHYINNNKIYNLSHINHLIFEKNKYNLNIDRTTKKHLEIDINVNGKQENTLFSVLNTTMTNMGSRLLKKWINNPITNYKLIELRQNAIQIIINNDLIYILKKNIKKIGDIERIITRIALKKATPIDLIKFKNALKAFPKIKNILNIILKTNQHIKSILNKIYIYIFIYPHIELLLHDALIDNPPHAIRDGYVIKSNFNLKLDTLREIYNNSEKYIRNFENKEKIRTGIHKLKINFNKLNGFFIELPKNKKTNYKIPKEYIKNKTLKHSERFYSKELQSFENLLIESKTNSFEYETNIYNKIINIIIHNIKGLLKTSKAIAALDVITTLSERAISLNFCKPIINKNKIGIKIIEGRHPIIESVNKHQFIPNNLYLNNKSNIKIITGPNMGGKSTYIRQNAIIVLLTYIGSYVPAKYAEIGPIDKIFTRIGSYDDLSAGKSSFMIEMQETANILNTATFKSLVLLDEIGRGTNPTEGLSIAWACLEKLIQIQALTLFSTHYFSLTQIEKKFQQIKNIHFNALITNNKITYMYNINQGATHNSYSLNVASLAHIPLFIINKSTHIFNILKKHKNNHTKIYNLIHFLKNLKFKKITMYLNLLKNLIKKI
ncbi:DNA mismatch repair protein MutS [Candidatus Portiera aleyrodidarum]|uniref:DNA mismatch repair protein MutS n=1 Tax=Candidatus Portiera aleyrodidarum TV TaxID=1297582 RepID=A0A8D3X865_9GAMM|nr:DNA mismatch repair protein MutS [Candidatus Portiera aleyrodidarum]AGI27179.1 DNA mismatch repair protein MutS [Candidatus Portiera aleyrodidarum TV]CEI59159.1 DNA mismatch repair protein MutS [Candidatus Portiera aleyrodidarum]